MKQNSDTGFLEQLAKDVLAQNEKSVTDYKNGKTNALGYLVGQCMKASKGKANPGIVKEIVTKNAKCIITHSKAHDRMHFSIS